MGLIGKLPLVLLSRLLLLLLDVVVVVSFMLLPLPLPPNVWSGRLSWLELPPVVVVAACWEPFVIFPLLFPFGVSRSRFVPFDEDNDWLLLLNDLLNESPRLITEPLLVTNCLTRYTSAPPTSAVPTPFDCACCSFGIANVCGRIRFSNGKLPARFCCVRESKSSRSVIEHWVPLRWPPPPAVVLVGLLDFFESRSPPVGLGATAAPPLELLLLLTPPRPSEVGCWRFGEAFFERIFFEISKNKILILIRIYIILFEKWNNFFKISRINRSKPK